MDNFILSCFYKQLQLEIAQTIFADNRVHHIGKINCTHEVNRMDLGLIDVCKNFSLPVTILNQCFEVSKDCDDMQNIAKVYTETDTLISFLNISHLKKEERIKFVKQMKAYAPKALFVDYELPDRNLAYPLYYSLMFGEYFAFFMDKITPKKRKEEDKHTPYKKNIDDFKDYMQMGALQGFVHDLQSQLEKKPRVIQQKTLLTGGLGLYYCEW